MIVFLDTSDTLEQCAQELGPSVEVGQLITPLTGRTNLGVRYAVDNGAFANFDAKNFRRLLERDMAHRSRCQFVAVPDVVGSARRTMEVWTHWSPQLRAWPLALVAQDGIEDMDIPWDEVDAVFIGGSTGWKTSAHAVAVAKAAKALDKWVHVGRVNTAERFEAWRDLADSVDGTGVARYSHMRKALTGTENLLMNCDGVLPFVGRAPAASTTPPGCVRL